LARPSACGDMRLRAAAGWHKRERGSQLQSVAGGFPPISLTRRSSRDDPQLKQQEALSLPDVLPPAHANRQRDARAPAHAAMFGVRSVLRIFSEPFATSGATSLATLTASACRAPLRRARPSEASLRVCAAGGALRGAAPGQPQVPEAERSRSGLRRDSASPVESVMQTTCHPAARRWSPAAA
jgi:hypothetical protein